MRKKYVNNYSEKLKDPRWQKKRLKILERDFWTCMSCCDTETTLHIHHKVYKAKEPWDEPDEHLITLCADCHETETNEMKNAIYILNEKVKIKCELHTRVLDIIELIDLIDFSDRDEFSSLSFALKFHKDDLIKHYKDYLKSFNNIEHNPNDPF